MKIPDQSGQNRQRLDYIDGLRGFAILLVLMTHAWVFSGAPALSFHVHKMSIVLAAVPAVGYIGVNLFLVLSGFCLAYPFMRDPNYRADMNIWKFWRKRVLRIVPAYYVSIIFVVGIILLFNSLLRVMPHRLLMNQHTTLGGFPTASDLLIHLFFIHNLFPQHVSTINGSYWSLALEFQLYILFPLLIAMFFRWGPWKTFTIIFLVQVVYRFGIHDALRGIDMGPLDFVLPKAVFGRMLDFYLGIMSAHWVMTQKENCLSRKWGLSVSAALLGTAFALTIFYDATSPILDLLWACGFALLICSAAHHSTIGHRALCYKPLVNLGLASYSVYLIHQPLVERTGFLLRLFLHDGPSYILLTFVCTPIIVGLGLLFFKFVEAPLLQLCNTKTNVAIATPVVAESVA